jgi:predicted molibdopterin-dependent oxidoreductase YjgC
MSMPEQFDLLQIIDAMDGDYCKQASEAMMQKSKDAGINIEFSKHCNDQEVSDFPSCDFCSVEYSGKLFCSKCKCVFYCSKVRTLDSKYSILICKS